MSVLIKDMGMPENCMDCKIKQYDEFENYHVCPFSGVMCLSIGRQDACPLVALPDHHGRLVDADACDLIDRQAMLKEFAYFVRKSDFFAETPTWNDAVLLAVSMPSAQPEPHWIPCSERLPEVGQDILMSVGGMYTAEGCLKEDGDWAQFRWDATLRKDMVDAWMPLPEPCREDGGD